MDRFLTAQRGAATALDSLQIPHCDYADDIALTSNTAESLQLQLNRFYDYTRFKGLKLNTDKTKVMVFFSRYTSAIPTFTYDGTPLELVIQFKYTLESLLLVMEACTQLLRKWQTTSGLPQQEATNTLFWTGMPNFWVKPPDTPPSPLRGSDHTFTIQKLLTS